MALWAEGDNQDPEPLPSPWELPVLEEEGKKHSLPSTRSQDTPEAPMGKVSTSVASSQWCHHMWPHPLKTATEHKEMAYFLNVEFRGLV